MNISENLQRIQTDKQNIANAINAKGVSCSVSESLDTYANKISQISGGSANFNGDTTHLITGIAPKSLTSGSWLQGGLTSFYNTSTLNVIKIPSSSSSTRATASLFIDIPRKYLPLYFTFSSNTYNSSWYSPYQIQIEIWNKSLSSWQAITYIRPSSHHFSFTNDTNMFYAPFFTYSGINTLAASVSSSGQNVLDNPNELLSYRITIQGQTYNSTESAHLVGISYFRIYGFDITELVK